MGLFNLWGKRTKEVPSHEESRANAEESLDIYSGMHDIRYEERISI